MPEPHPDEAWLTYRAQKPLEMLADVPGILGALLMTRDGLPVVCEMEKLRRPETLAAMAAATLTASEVMSSELNLTGPVLFRIDHARMTIAGMAISQDLMIVAFAEPGTQIETAFARVRSAARNTS